MRQSCSDEPSRGTGNANRELFDRDIEYVAIVGERVAPVCLVAYEVRPGRRHRLFFDALGGRYENPLSTDPDVLFVALAAQAEWSVFLSLGWPLPQHVLDLFAEFRCQTNGLTKTDGRPVESSLIAAPMYFGLDSLTVVENESMRNPILRGHPYSAEDRREILDYCSKDVEALGKLLPAMLSAIELHYSIFRGRHPRAVASIEFSGVPIDAATFRRLESNWDRLKVRLASDMEAEHGFGVYHGTHWSDERFERPLSRMGILDETGAPIGAQQELMWHGNVATTMNIYGNASVRAKQQANSMVEQTAITHEKAQIEPQAEAI